MKTVFIKVYKYACGKRSLDANRVSKYLSKNNYKIINKPKDANIIIFFSCATSKYDADKSINIIKKLQKYDGELIVAGCLPGIEPKRLKNIFNGKTIVTKNLDQIDQLFPENKIKFNNIDDANILYPNINENDFYGVLNKIINNSSFYKKLFFNFRESILKYIFNEQSFSYSELTTKKPFIVRISQGCVSNCSYCAIKKAVGPIVSKPIDQCINEFKKGLNEGYQEFSLTGDDVGAYGLDIKKTFPELLDKITNLKGNYQIIIRCFHPRWVVKYINELEMIFKRNKVNLIGIPIQSASSRLLKLMNRYSNKEKMYESIKRIKKSAPDLTIYTHYIIGFPSETFDEFKETLRLLLIPILQVLFLDGHLDQRLQQYLLNQKYLKTKS